MAVDFNFALFLTLSVLITGFVYLLEWLWLRPARVAAAFNLRTQKGSSKSVDALDQAEAALLREPWYVEYAVSFFPVLLIVFVIRSFLVEPYQIPTGSMIPSLLIGDFILVNKYEYGVRLPVIGTKLLDVNDPKTGDVMVFIPPHEDEYFIKRVIGTPGDTIRYEEKILTVNDEEATLQFIARLPPDDPQYLVFKENLAGVEHFIHRNLYRDPRRQEWVVPEGMYFMMGDNRDRSSDSRYWGLVPEANIVGKAFAVWMHKEPGLFLPEFDRVGSIQ